MISPNTKLAGTGKQPYFRCSACPDDRLHAGGYTVANAHCDTAHPGQQVSVELLTLGAEALYHPSPNKEDVRKGKR